MSAQLKLDSPYILIESRLTKSEILTAILKEELSDIKRDVRWLIGIVLSFNLTMTGIMLKGFHLV